MNVTHSRVVSVSRHYRLLAIVAGAALSGTMLAGCSNTGDAKSSTAPTGAAINATVDKNLQSQVPSDVRTRGTLAVGVALGSPPEEFEENGKIVGWEVDLAAAVAQTLGLKVDLKPDSFDSLIPGLQSQKYDAAIGQIGITSAREQAIDQVSTAKTNEAMAALSSANIKIKTLDDLCGLTVATTRGSREADFAQQQSDKCTAAGKKAIKVSVYDQPSQADLAMLSGRADIDWNGATAIAYFVKTTNGKAEVVGNYLDPTPMGTALAKGSKLSEPVRGAVQHLIDDGTYAKIMSKWGLKDYEITKSEVNPTIPAK